MTGCEAKGGAGAAELERLRRALHLGRIAQRFAEAIAEAPHWAVEETLSEQEGDLLALADATGAVVLLGDRHVTLGQAPSDDAVAEIMASWRHRDRPLVLDRAVGPAGEGAGVAGVLAVPVTPDHGAVVWTRPEHLHEVERAGRPQDPRGVATEAVGAGSRPWTGAEVEAALSAARVIGGAFLRRERVLSSYDVDLQRALLPASLPALPGLVLDSFTAPDGRGIIGGDWYDAFVTSTGLLALVLGDIAGHGLEAAAAMAQFRNGLRAYLVDEVSPARALDRMNALARDLLPKEMATALVGLLDLTTLRLTLSSAGHPDPLLLRGGHAETLTPGRNTVLGFQARAGTDREIALHAGDTLVLFSDGLVESRQHAYDSRVDRLRAVAAEALDEGSDGLAGRLAQTMTQDERSDDVTVLTVTLLPPTTGGADDVNR